VQFRSLRDLGLLLRRQIEKWALTEEEEHGPVECSANESRSKHTSPKTLRSIADRGRDDDEYEDDSDEADTTS
jgi:hypothetical protein